MLRDEQQKTIATPRLRYGLLARVLFLTIDLLYGRPRSLSKFKVLEIVARVPYQAWESVAYVAITHTHSLPQFARRVFEFVEEARRQQDNEQWHLFILEELLRERDVRQGFLRFVLVPQLLALVFYHVSWMLYVVKPAASYRLNAEFEDHAEHEYMEFVAEHPELEQEGYAGAFAEDYGSFATLSDLLRRIALDEREHKEESLARMGSPRFGLHAA
jgi:ubiquinol oxidase